MTIAPAMMPTSNGMPVSEKKIRPKPTSIEPTQTVLANSVTTIIARLAKWPRDELELDDSDPGVYNNLGVKKCFVPMFQARTLPPRVDVGFTILPAGNATKIALKSPPTLRGSELERCLQSVISRVSFPPTTGNGTVTTYPFILQ